MASDSHGQGGDGRVGLETRGQRELSAEEREESRVTDAESVERLEKDSRGGREAVTHGAREEAEREQRLRRTETVGVGGGEGRESARGREKEMKWWSEVWRGVTVTSEQGLFLRKTRSRRLPALWVGGERWRERSKERRT